MYLDFNFLITELFESAVRIVRIRYVFSDASTVAAPATPSFKLGFEHVAYVDVYFVGMVR